MEGTQLFYLNVADISEFLEILTCQNKEISLQILEVPKSRPLKPPMIF